MVSELLAEPLDLEVRVALDLVEAVRLASVLRVVYSVVLLGLDALPDLLLD